MTLILISILLQAVAGTRYFYADVRWDNVTQFKNDPASIPWNHGLRILPALYVARDKLIEDLRLMSASARVSLQYGKTYDPDLLSISRHYFYQSPGTEAQFAFSDHDAADPSIYNLGNMDFGFCQNTAMKPETEFLEAPVIRGDTYSDYCQNKPAEAIFRFSPNDNVTNRRNYTRFLDLSEDDDLVLVLPDGTGLESDDKDEFDLQFANLTQSSLSLGDIYSRVAFVQNRTGAEFAGIVASTTNAIETAYVASSLGVPNIVASVVDPNGLWPQSSSVNFADRVLDSSLVLGLEDWMIIDQLVFTLKELSWNTGTMQIFHESGSSEVLAGSIRRFLREAMEERVKTYSRVLDDLFVERVDRWDYFISDEARSNMTDQVITNRLKEVKKITRVILLLGKEPFLRGMLKLLKSNDMIQFDTSHDHGSMSSDTENFGIIAVPENGAPCGPLTSRYNESTEDSDVKTALYKAILICHNAHNRPSWVFRNGGDDNVMTLQTSAEEKSRIENWWKRTPPSINIVTGNDPKNDERPLLALEDQVDMTHWKNFETLFRESCDVDLNFTYPADQAVSGLAGFAHDTLVWGFFTDYLRKWKPSLFQTPSGHFTLLSVYGDGATFKETTQKKQANLNRIGWPGMFSLGDLPSVAPFNATHDHQNFSLLVNDGPWHEVYNRYTFKDNRPYGGVPHTIRQFNGTAWKRIASLMPHRRQSERVDLDYSTELGKVGAKYFYDYEGNAFDEGSPVYDFFKFLGPFEEFTSNVMAVESNCKYDDSVCSRQRMQKVAIPCSVIAALILIAVVTYGGNKWWERRKYNIELHLKRWKLAPSDAINMKNMGAGVASTLMSIGSMAQSFATFATGTAGAATGTNRAQSKGGTNNSSVSGRSGKLQVYTDIMTMRGKKFAIKPLEGAAAQLVSTETRAFLEEMKELYEISHPNIAMFGGCYEDPDSPGTHFIFTEYCTKGSLQDVLEDKESLSMVFKLNFMCDIIKGMDYIHSNKFIESHGYLKSSNVLITEHFAAKISDFGILQRTNDSERVAEMERIPKSIRSMWTAPEILRSYHKSQIHLTPSKSCKGRKEGDVYSFGIICHEILQCSGPFNTSDDGNDIDAPEVVELVKKSRSQKPYRPAFSGITSDNHEIFAREMAKECWQERPDDRPTFRHMKAVYIPQLRDEKIPLGVAVVMKKKEESQKLEHEIKEYKHTISNEHKRFTDMQKHFLPEHVSLRLMMGETFPPNIIKSASILVLEISGVSHHGSDIWRKVTENAEHVDVHPVACSNGTMVLIANHTGSCPDNHVQILQRIFSRTRETGAGMNKVLNHMNKTSSCSVRAGLDTGPVYVGLIGDKFKHYRVWGGTYDSADILRRAAPAGTCLATSAVKTVLKDEKVNLSRYEKPIPDLEKSYSTKGKVYIVS